MIQRDIKDLESIPDQTNEDTNLLQYLIAKRDHQATIQYKYIPSKCQRIRAVLHNK